MRINNYPIKQKYFREVLEFGLHQVHMFLVPWYILPSVLKELHEILQALHSLLGKDNLVKNCYFLLWTLLLSQPVVLTGGDHLLLQHW